MLMFASSCRDSDMPLVLWKRCLCSVNQILEANAKRLQRLQRLHSQPLSNALPVPRIHTQDVFVLRTVGTLRTGRVGYGWRSMR